MYKDDSLQKAAVKKANAKRAGTRSRNICFIAYPDDLPEDWQDRLSESRVRWVEGPLHNKDTWSKEDEINNPDHKEGELKKLHCHNLMMFENPTSVDQAKRFFADIFGTNDDGSIPGIATPQICRDRSGAIRYMCHLDNPSKPQYDFSDIVGHNGCDPNELVKFSVTEQLHKMIEVEEFIDCKDIREYAALCRYLRTEHIDLYQIVSTKNTIHFRSYINSHRHAMEAVERRLSGDYNVSE